MALSRMNTRRPGGRRWAAFRVGCRICAFLGAGLPAVAAANIGCDNPPGSPPQFCLENSKTITINLSDLGLAGDGMAVGDTGGIVATQINPLDPATSNPVDVPATVGTLPASGIITLPLVSPNVPLASETDYIWRLLMRDNLHDKLPPQPDTYIIANSTGTNTGELSHGLYATPRLPVRLILGSRVDQAVVVDKKTNWYVSRQLSLEIDLSAIRYSGDYTGFITTTLAY